MHSPFHLLGEQCIGVFEKSDGVPNQKKPHLTDYPLQKIPFTNDLKCVNSYRRKNPTAVTDRCAQRCDSDGVESTLTEVAVTAMGQKWM